MKNIFISLVVASSISVPTIAQADVSKWYIGGAAGQAKLKEDLDRPAALITSSIADDLSTIGLTTLSSSSNGDEEDTAYKVYIGYRATENFAFEAGYLNLGEFSADVNLSVTDGVDSFDINSGIDIETDGFFFTLLGFVPVSKQVELFAKVGMFFYDTDWKASAAITDGINASSASLSGGNSDQEVTWGFGANYLVNDSWTIRLEYERYERLEVDEDLDEDESDVDLLSLGINYYF